MGDLNVNDVRALLKKHGSRGARLLSTLGKQHPIIRAMDTDIGKAILEDAIFRMDVLLLKIIEEDIKETELAEYRVLKDITTRWASRITAYFTNLNEVGGK